MRVDRVSVAYHLSDRGGTQDEDLCGTGCSQHCGGWPCTQRQDDVDLRVAACREDDAGTRARGRWIRRDGLRRGRGRTADDDGECSGVCRVEWSEDQPAGYSWVSYVPA